LERDNSQPLYVLVIREQIRDLNKYLFNRWFLYQQDICCKYSVRCCGLTQASYYNLFSQNHDKIQFSQQFMDDNEKLFVLPRIKFIHYSFYVDALLQSKVILDTFPYGGKI
jgi:hypothetical protein